MIFINLEFDKILENTKEKIDNGIEKFCNELSNYLNNSKNNEKSHISTAENILDGLKTFNNELNNTYFYIASGTEFFTIQTYENNKCISSSHMHKSEFPEGTKVGTALRWKNGEFIIDEKLTETLINQNTQIKESIDNLYQSFRTEGTYYKVEELEGDYITLINQDTGVSFSESEFTRELYDSLEYGTMLKYENGNYVIDNKYSKNEIIQTIDEDELVSKEIRKFKEPITNTKGIEKILDFVSDALIDIIEAKGYGDINTYFVTGTENGKIYASQRFGGKSGNWIKIEDPDDTIEFGTIIREVNGKYIVDKELTHESLKRIKELEE